MKNALLFGLCLGAMVMSIFAWKRSSDPDPADAGSKPADASAATAPRPTEAERKLAEAQREIKRLRASLARKEPDTTTTRAEDSVSELDAEPAGVGGSSQGSYMRARMLSRIDLQFAALWRRLRFTPEQIRRYEELLLEHRMMLVDFNRVASEQGVIAANDPAGYARAKTDVRDAAEAEFAQALGPVAYAEYQKYAETLPQRESVERTIQPYLSRTSLPLTETQADQLVRILAEYPAGRAAAISRRALTAAIPVLTPEQFRALQQGRLVERPARDSRTGSGGGR